MKMFLGLCLSEAETEKKGREGDRKDADGRRHSSDAPRRGGGGGGAGGGRGGST